MLTSGIRLLSLKSGLTHPRSAHSIVCPAFCQAAVSDSVSAVLSQVVTQVGMSLAGNGGEFSPGGE